MAAEPPHSASGGPHLGAPFRGPLKQKLQWCCLLLVLLLFCCPLDAYAATAATATATAAAAAAAAAALLLPLPACSKKVFGIAKGGKFEAIGDFCFSVPPGLSGALVAETMLQEEGHELLIHSKSATEEYREAYLKAGVSIDDAEEEGLVAACNALQANARAVDSSMDGKDMTAWYLWFERE
ncbi:uncharacterized protein EMH_0001700 [Eimeria mitis]|uniref:Uncharacterized protein n=1 Tax=Eimeria mitis TaxID=44415 RepID=U6JSU8_9EIME|nr:uncharacterized protein EMH_0001700 [Eimeria mitis]CDJ28535.1 hypothetical protein EMH_0001700 [Eimeria mitis]